MMDDADAFSLYVNEWCEIEPKIQDMPQKELSPFVLRSDYSRHFL
jgi:hypothetical protein